jgi:hypothetical protein
MLILFAIVFHTDSAHLLSLVLIGAVTVDPCCR